MTRLALIANPAAGGGRTSRLLPAVEARLRSAGHDLVVSRTADLPDADGLTAAAVADGRVVAAMGGDGLVGRVAGAVSVAGGLLAVLPGGRGNDFARALGISHDPVAACALLEPGAGLEVVLDLASVHGQSFVGNASLGFDSVVQEIANVSRLPLGQQVYLYATLRALSRWKAATYTVTVDGVASTVRGFSVVMANSGVYGNGMRIAPNASLRDGLLDVVLTTEVGKLTFLRLLTKVFSGAHVRESCVQVLTGATVTVAADRAFRVFADGDPYGSLPCTVTVQPAALRALVPSDSPVLRYEPPA